MGFRCYGGAIAIISTVDAFAKEQKIRKMPQTELNLGTAVFSMKKVYGISQNTILNT